MPKPNFFIQELGLFYKDVWKDRTYKLGLLFNSYYLNFFAPDDTLLCVVSLDGTEIRILPAFFDYYTRPDGPLATMLNQINGNLIYNGKKWKPIPKADPWDKGHDYVSIDTNEMKATYWGRIKEGGRIMNLEAPITLDKKIITIGIFEKITS